MQTILMKMIIVSARRKGPRVRRSLPFVVKSNFISPSSGKIKSNYLFFDMIATLLVRNALTYYINMVLHVFLVGFTLSIRYSEKAFCSIIIILIMIIDLYILKERDKRQKNT